MIVIVTRKDLEQMKLNPNELNKENFEKFGVPYDNINLLVYLNGKESKVIKDISGRNEIHSSRLSIILKVIGGLPLSSAKTILSEILNNIETFCTINQNNKL